MSVDNEGPVLAAVERLRKTQFVNRSQTTHSGAYLDMALSREADLRLVLDHVADLRTEVHALREVTAFGDRERQYVAADGDPLFSAMSDALAEFQNPEAGGAITNVFAATLAVTFTARQHSGAPTLMDRRDGGVVSTFHRILPFLWYAAGSVCFLVGTLIVIWREVRP